MTRPCVACNKVFTVCGKQGRTLFCSDACRAEHNRRQNNESKARQRGYSAAFGVPFCSRLGRNAVKACRAMPSPTVRHVPIREHLRDLGFKTEDEYLATWDRDPAKTAWDNRADRVGPEFAW